MCDSKLIGNKTVTVMCCIPLDINFSKSFCDNDKVALCHLNALLLTQRLHFLGRHSHSRKWIYVCERFRGNGAQHQRSRIRPNVTTGYSHTTRKTDRPDSQTNSNGEHESSDNKRTQFFFSCFFSGWAAPALLPSSRAESCLYRAFPIATATTTRPIRLTGPVTPRHAKTHRIWPQTG